MNIYSDYEDEINKYYHTVDVTNGGIEYILGHLSYGRTLSKLVTKHIHVEEGWVETFAHRSVKENKLFQFERMGVGRELPESFINFPKDDSRWAIRAVDDFFVIPTIKKFLTLSEQNICIIEDIDSSPSGWRSPSSWRSTTPPYITFDEKDVYSFIDDKDITRATIRQTFSIATTSWSMRAFLTSIPTDMKPLRNNQEVAIKTLEVMAKRTKKIIATAYDGEGELIWHCSE